MLKFVLSSEEKKIILPLKWKEGLTWQVWKVVHEKPQTSWRENYQSSNLVYHSLWQRIKCGLEKAACRAEGPLPATLSSGFHFSISLSDAKTSSPYKIIFCRHNLSTNQTLGLIYRSLHSGILHADFIRIKMFPHSGYRPQWPKPLTRTTPFLNQHPQKVTWNSVRGIRIFKNHHKTRLSKIMFIPNLQRTS